MEHPLGWAHFLGQADAVARGSLAILLAMSIGTWSLILGKGLALWRAHRAARQFLRDFWAAPHLDAVAHRLRETGVTDAFSHLVHHGYAAIEQHRAGSQRRGLIDAGTPDQFLTRALKRAIAQDKARLESGLTTLATVASSAPFVGLFGTVWGIHRALLAIGAGGPGTLDQVAGPVGEALIMTALGLAVALPAAIAHNAFARVLRRTIGELEAFAHDVFTFLATGLKQAPCTSDVAAASARTLVSA